MKNKTYPCIVVSMINHVSAHYTPPEQLIAEIFDKVYKVTGISMEKLKGKSQKGDIIYARHLTMYLLKKKVGLIVREIGKLLNRDHSTVIHGVQSFQNKIDTEPETYNEVMGLLQEGERKTA